MAEQFRADRSTEEKGARAEEMAQPYKPEDLIPRTHVKSKVGCWCMQSQW